MTKPGNYALNDDRFQFILTTSIIIHEHRKDKSCFREVTLSIRTPVNLTIPGFENFQQNVHFTTC